MNLQDAIREAARRAFSALREAHPGEDFYYYALVTTGDALCPGPSAASTQGLARTLADYRARGAASTAGDLRWSEADSAYDGFGGEYFAKVEQLLLTPGDHRQLPHAEYEAEVVRRFAAMEGALRELDAEGFFGAGVARERVVINVVAPGDESEKAIIERASRLNPPASLIPLREDLEWESLRCPECRSPVCYTRNGEILDIRCSSPVCSWGYDTIFPVPIQLNKTRYSLTIPALPDATPAVMIVLNQRFTHGIPVTRDLAFRGKLPPLKGSAVEVWREAQRLHRAGIPFQIKPKFPFDLDAPEKAFGPPDGVLSAEAVKALPD